MEVAKPKMLMMAYKCLTCGARFAIEIKSALEGFPKLCPACEMDDHINPDETVVAEPINIDDILGVDWPSGEVRR